MDVSCVEGAASWCENDRDCRLHNLILFIISMLRCNDKCRLLGFPLILIIIRLPFRSSSARRRVCRSTKCGHNVCLLQFGSSWIVAWRQYIQLLFIDIYCLRTSFFRPDKVVVFPFSAYPWTPSNHFHPWVKVTANIDMMATLPTHFSLFSYLFYA